MGSPGSEAEAEGALASAGIAREMAGLPTTRLRPILPEIRDCDRPGSDSGMLPLSREEASWHFKSHRRDGAACCADTLVRLFKTTRRRLRPVFES